VTARKKARKQVLAPKNASNQNHSENVSARLRKHSHALVEVPIRLGQFMRLANLLPSFLRGLASLRGPGELSEDSQGGRVCFLSVQDLWDTRTDEGAIGAMFWFLRVVDRLPIELQAFILHDDDGRFYKPEWEMPLFDPEHTQLAENITLSERSAEELHTIIANARERITLETSWAQERLSAQSPRNKSSKLSSFPNWRRRRFLIGTQEFADVGIGYLADRARQRLFFILGADEMLDALVEPNEEDINNKLLRARRYEKSGALTSQPFVQDDEVQLAPPLVFTFFKGVQASRVRRCEICENYFWAGRKDKKVCSEQCGATLRKRRGRELYRLRQQAEDHNLEIVVNAIAQGRRTYEEISKQSKLSLDDVSNLLAILVDREKVKSRPVAGEREFYMTRSAKKGK
jgi:hypothetical protein